MHSNSTRANFVNGIPCFMRKYPRKKTKGKKKKKKKKKDNKKNTVGIEGGNSNGYFMIQPRTYNGNRTYTIWNPYVDGLRSFKISGPWHVFRALYTEWTKKGAPLSLVSMSIQEPLFYDFQTPFQRAHNCDERPAICFRHWQRNSGLHMSRWCSDPYENF